MKIYTANPSYYQPVRELFSGHDVEVLPKNYVEQKIRPDLLVFTGGEDIYPERYGGSVPKGNTWFNPARDELEFNILRNVQLRRLPATKVLGICRGHQLLNVGFGGSLYYDIFTSLGRDHSPAHKLDWILPTALSEIFPLVNSMHHQGIRRIGDSRSVRTYAIEPTTGIAEVVCWDDMYLGVQFHPEFMSRSPNIQKFVEFMENWVAGKTSVYGMPKPAETKEKRARVSKISTMWDLNPAPNQPFIIPDTDSE